MRAEPIAKPHAFHAEGPVWWPEWSLEGPGELRYVDMFAGDVLTVRGDDVDRVHVGTIAAALRPRGSGGALIAVERGFALSAQNDLSDLQVMQPIWDDPSVRFNDGGCDPAGNFYCGTMAYDQHEGGASLYLLTTEGMASPVLGGLTIANGIGWSPDGRTAYFNDTPTRTIWAFDWEPATGLTERRPWVELPDDLQGSPDGLWVDQEGGVWIALYGGSAVHRYVDRTLSQVVEVPGVTNVTACTFGGDQLQTLYITTTKEDVPAGEQPLAGAVFAVEPGVGGLPVAPFGG
ncbi:SMP-30/gluconolactonase/LRE family protein [Flexivirga caeni]|uniref:SMP-30/gluconolactonase/LRE family protein n=1 Tax=Flexivirga caeni TaxID=2294115 RepID=A0A3M9MKE1_9MICO|nr:SMP-30/gluconolactonase/LRE family protein [Flexivirga caeni]RNI25353.1 SMP-30/gluconolactonase/LRE family protein [Flexivirga caeni]